MFHFPARSHHVVIPWSLAMRYLLVNVPFFLPSTISSFASLRDEVSLIPSFTFHIVHRRIPGFLRFHHLPPVFLLRRPVLRIIRRIGHRLPPPHTFSRVIFYRKVRILVHKLTSRQFPRYPRIDSLLPAWLIALPQSFARASPPFILAFRRQ